MRITMNTVYAGADPETGASLTLQPGESHDFRNDVAEELIAGGFAFDPAERERAEEAELEARRAAKLKAQAGAPTTTEETSSGPEGTNAADQPAPRSKRRR